MIEQLHESAVQALQQDQSVTMLNLMKFHQQSRDGDGSGWDAYVRYSQLANKEIKARGGRIIWAANVRGVALGPDSAGDWDYAALVYYPDPNAFLDMMTSDAYGLANRHRTNGCKEHLILATEVAYSKLAD